MAGRTDAGVHAKGQVAHCDMLKEWVPKQLMGALNHHLRPHPIAIVDCRVVSLNGMLDFQRYKDVICIGSYLVFHLQHTMSGGLADSPCA